MTAFQLEALEHAWLPLAVAAASSAVQWLFAARSPMRLLSSLHGVVFIAAFALAFVVAPFEDASFYAFLPFLGLLMWGLGTCLANPFIGASHVGVALLTSILSLGAGAYLGLFGAILIESTWF